MRSMVEGKSSMLRNQAPKPRSGGVQRARTLRKNMSLPEVLLWRVLQTRPGGLKFRKQHPSGAFILDFYCNDAGLVIEVDGEAHSRGDRPARDAVRDAWFLRAGLGTLRIPASLVLGDLDATVAVILAAARARLPLHHCVVPLPVPGRNGVTPPHIRNTPNRGSPMGALSVVASARPSTSRVWAGSITPSSHSRAVAW